MSPAPGRRLASGAPALRRRRPSTTAWIALLAGASLAVLPRAGRSEVLRDEKAALEHAFPGQRVERRTIYLTDEQVSLVQNAARSRLPSPVVTVFEARGRNGPAGRAVLDTFVVRTMQATMLTVIAPDGTLRMSILLGFSEPPDYLPREGWLRMLEGRSLDDDLWPGRGVDAVTGATLTVQALTDATRRALALDALVLRGPR
jgi:FMN-binding domain